MRKNLLVASVFAPSSNNNTWSKLQSEFLQRTTGAGYDHVIAACGIPPGEPPLENVIHRFDRSVKGDTGHISHAMGLNWLLDYARSHPYRYYLFLDSDCFPIRKNWLTDLTRQMARHERMIAAPLRLENLDVFPHPCAMLIRGEFIHDTRLNFGHDAEMDNLLGVRIHDIGVGMNDLRSVILPLVRSNVINPHPIACAIYSHYFYHHGAGSRMPRFRFTQNYGLVDHWYKLPEQDAHAELLFRNLKQNPAGFIDKLTGKHEPFCAGALNSHPANQAGRSEHSSPQTAVRGAIQYMVLKMKQLRHSMTSHYQDI